MNSIIASFFDNWLITIIQVLLFAAALSYAFFDFKKETLKRSKTLPAEARMVITGILVIAVFTLLLSGYQHYKYLHSLPFRPTGTF